MIDESKDHPAFTPEQYAAQQKLLRSYLRRELDKYGWPVELDDLKFFEFERQQIYMEKLEGQPVWKLADFCRCLMPPQFFYMIRNAWRDGEQDWTQLVRDSPIYGAYVRRIAATELGEKGLVATRIEADYFLKAEDLMAEARDLAMFKYMPSRMRVWEDSVTLDGVGQRSNGPNAKPGPIDASRTLASPSDLQSTEKEMSRRDVAKLLDKTKGMGSMLASKRVSRAIDSGELPNGPIPESIACAWILNAPEPRPRKDDFDVD